MSVVTMPLLCEHGLGIMLIEDLCFKFNYTNFGFHLLCGTHCTVDYIQETCVQCTRKLELCIERGFVCMKYFACIFFIYTKYFSTDGDVVHVVFMLMVVSLTFKISYIN